MGAGVGLAEWGGASAAWAGSPRPSDIVTMDAVELSSAIRRRRVSKPRGHGRVPRSHRAGEPARERDRVHGRSGRAAPPGVAPRRPARRGRVLGWMHGFPHGQGSRRREGVRHYARLPASGIRSPRGTTSAERIKAAGPIVIGKTNSPSSASPADLPVFGTTLNAYDQSRTAGGSSGGAAVALALRWCRGRRERLRRLASQPGGLQQRARLPDLLRADTRPRRRPLDRPARGRRPDGPAWTWRCCSRRWRVRPGPSVLDRAGPRALRRCA